MNWPEYDMRTGIFIWPSGQQAGTIEKKGYRQITIDKHRYKAHRLAWFLVTGKWPKCQIDHINGNKDDNRWCNLREATNSENKRNMGPRADNTSGFKCVSRHHDCWRVSIVFPGEKRQRHMGRFHNLVDAAVCANAHIAYCYGGFGRLNPIPQEGWTHD